MHHSSSRRSAISSTIVHVTDLGLRSGVTWHLAARPTGSRLPMKWCSYRPTWKKRSALQPLPAQTVPGKIGKFNQNIGKRACRWRKTGHGFLYATCQLLGLFPGRVGCHVHRMASQILFQDCRLPLVSHRRNSRNRTVFPEFRFDTSMCLPELEYYLVATFWLGSCYFVYSKKVKKGRILLSFY